MIDLAAHRLTAIFAKHPEPGAVKTRLVPPVDYEQAAALAEAMLTDLVRRSARGAFRTGIAFAPAEAEAWFRERFGDLPLWPQRGPGLAERLAAFFDDRLGAGGATVVAIGADAPLASIARIERAHAALERGADVVVGPDSGGGYDLIGLARPEPRLFLDVPMSSAGMGDRTIALARRLGLATEVLEPGFDVDVPADLERLAAEVGRCDPDDPDYPTEAAAWLERWTAR